MSVLRMNLLNYLNTVDFVHFDHIDDDWKQILTTCESTADAHPDYCWSAVIDDSFEAWDTNGDTLKNALDLNRQYGYLSSNTVAWDTACKKPKLIMDWEARILEKLPIDLPVGIVIKETPGHTMPWHQDRYTYFKHVNEVTDYVVRFIVFLKDWQIGHFIQAGDGIISHWKAGDVILWHPDRWHLSTNAGINNKWTYSVTGVLHENVQCTCS